MTTNVTTNRESVTRDTRAGRPGTLVYLDILLMAQRSKWLQTFQRNCEVNDYKRSIIGGDTSPSSPTIIVNNAQLCGRLRRRILSVLGLRSKGVFPSSESLEKVRVRTFVSVQRS